MVSDETASDIFSFGIGLILGDITYGIVELAKGEKEDDDNEVRSMRKVL